MIKRNLKQVRQEIDEDYKYLEENKKYFSGKLLQELEERQKDLLELKTAIDKVLGEEEIIKNGELYCDYFVGQNPCLFCPIHNTPLCEIAEKHRTTPFYDLFTSDMDESVLKILNCDMKKN